MAGAVAELLLDAMAVQTEAEAPQDSSIKLAPPAQQEAEQDAVSGEDSGERLLQHSEASTSGRDVGWQAPLGLVRTAYKEAYRC